MGFKTVYHCLIDIFPQVDARLLRAVAIEHPKDADAAVEVVLSEILPFVGTNIVVSSPPSVISSSNDMLDGGAEEETLALRHRRSGLGRVTESSSESRPVIGEHSSSVGNTIASSSESRPVIGQRCSSVGNTIALSSDSRPVIGEHSSRVGNTIASSSESRPVLGEHSSSVGNTIASSLELRSFLCAIDNCAGKTTESSPELNPAVQDYIRNTDLTGSIYSVLTDQDISLIHTGVVAAHGNVDSDTLHGNTDSEELILLGKPQTQEKGSQQQSNQGFNLLSTALVQGVDVGSIEACDNPVIQLPLDCESNINIGYEHGHEHASDSLVQENGDSDVCFSGHKNEDPDNSVVTDYEESPQIESPVHAVTSVSEDRLNACKYMSSKHDNKISLLEKMVEDAKSNKKILLAAMESFMNMMAEVELKEKAAELTQEEAAKGGLDILVQVEELKKMIERAKQANDMHAGEVYGEKAILATESRELQARLHSLSDDRDSALAILDEMHQTLQDRLAVAEDIRKVAEQEKFEKEESARNALAELELIMDEVAHESKMLQLEAEENSKLREFLMDRGRMVDTLQGEISVICLDVRFLKGRFDEGVPLSKSISSSQTTCILASSGSSLKSTPPEIALDLSVKTKSSKFSSSASSVASGNEDVEPPKITVDEERIINCYTSPLEDGWEIFEAAEFPGGNLEYSELPR